MVWTLPFYESLRWISFHPCPGPLSSESTPPDPFLITASVLYYSFTWPFTFTPSMSSLWLPTRQFFRRISISSLKAWMYYIFLFHTKYINSRLLKEGAVKFTANSKPAKQEKLLIKTWWWIPSLRDRRQRSKSWSDLLWKEIKMHVPQFLGYIGQSLKSKHM